MLKCGETTYRGKLSYKQESSHNIKQNKYITLLLVLLVFLGFSFCHFQSKLYQVTELLQTFSFAIKFPLNA